MSFLKISDPVKRDQTVKEYLELKKNIRDNLLRERTGEQELQTELTKFYRPITEMQKATAREITEGLKPIREGIEKLPQAMQPLGEASGEAPEEYEEEEKDKSIGEIAKGYLNTPPLNRDETIGIRKKEVLYYIGNKQGTIVDSNILIDNELFKGTPGLWELIMLKNPINYHDKDYEKYKRLMIKTKALHRYYNPNNPYPRGSDSYKWKKILRPIWYSKQFEGKGVVIMPSDLNALLERLDLLLASQEAGHTGVGNELVSICDELKRQGVLGTKTYKKLNSVIKNDST